MLYMRWLKFLDRVAHKLARLPFKDRWGFNLGENLCHWAGMKRAEYCWRVQDASGLTPAEVTVVPKCFPGKHVGTTFMITWPEGGSCDRCAAVNYTTGSVA